MLYSRAVAIPATTDPTPVAESPLITPVIPNEVIVEKRLPGRHFHSIQGWLFLLQIAIFIPAYNFPSINAIQSHFQLLPV